MTRSRKATTISPSSTRASRWASASSCTAMCYDEDKRPVPDTLVEIWQANACGRYVHNVDQHPAPLDPNFTGAGRTVTDKNGYYKFITVKPGAYPWGNHRNAWRPNHIHFSVFGHSFLSRAWSRRCISPATPVPVRPDLQFGDRREGALAHDLQLRSGKHGARLGALLPLRYRAARPRSRPQHIRKNTMSEITPSQTVGPFFAYGLRSMPPRQGP